MTPLSPAVLRRIAPAVALALCAIPLPAEIAGRVVNSQGVAVEGARVGVSAGGESTLTGARGLFRLPVEPPALLEVRHPRFELLEAEVTAETAGDLELVLFPKQEFYEEVVVSAARGGDAAAPVSIAATLIHPEDRAAPPSTLAELVTAVPGVSENGQGGIFQTYSVRGISRQRVMTLVAGMRIESERRAGAAVSFVDPLLMRSVDVLRGPSSSYYGSGALGGVVQLFPRVHEGLSAAAGYRGQGGESYQTVGWGDGGWSLGLAHRRAGDAETPAGDRLPSGFEQLSAVAERDWQAGGLLYQVTAIGAVGRDIGKPNSDFPVRTTVYPEEEHLLLRFALRSPDRWRLEAWVHPNELSTRVVESDRLRRSELANDATDFGLNFQRELDLTGPVSARVGIDYFGRRSVRAEERISPLPGLLAPEILQLTLDDAGQDEAGLYGAAEWNVGTLTLLAGGRYAWQRQTNGGGPGESEGALTGFAGVLAPLGGGWELAANLGTGLRFPSLSERFFSGVTGRGRVVGNADLEAESSVAADLGLRYFGERLFLTGALFRTEIDDYIERVEIEPDLLTFVNLTSGAIEGVELEGAYQVTAAWSLSFGGHRMRGREEGGKPLADVPATRLHLGAAGGGERGRHAARFAVRDAKGDPGPGEMAIPSAELLSASFTRHLSDDLRVTVSGTNLLDREFFGSADDKAVLSPGRSIGVELGWRR
ncbi:MAG: TonB-dependent receptor [Thermoanaerobaculia bacterium]|nr:TonB-dependent receptor [Thermoanaerobaculia bacterium]